MKVQYTIPGLQPSRVQSSEAGGDLPGRSFKKRLQRISTSVPVSWKKLLRLDRPLIGPEAIGPPPKPATLVAQDVASGRLRWRNLLERQSQAFETLNSEQKATGEMRSVQQMLTLLLNYQMSEDEVISRHLSESQG